MVKSKYGLYSVCVCNHESSYHGDNLKKCSATVPVGHEGYRGWVNPKIPHKSCDCKKFKFSSKNTANPKSSEKLK